MDTWAYAVPRLAMLGALREDWALNQRFLELCFRKNTVLLGQVRELSFDQAERRIARTLLNLAAQYGRPCPEGVRISIRFTHQDVAGIINTSRITTNKVMKRMEEEGILLKREGRYICLLYTSSPSGGAPCACGWAGWPCAGAAACCGIPAACGLPGPGRRWSAPICGRSTPRPCCAGCGGRTWPSSAAR